MTALSPAAAAASSNAHKLNGTGPRAGAPE